MNRRNVVLNKRIPVVSTTIVVVVPTIIVQFAKGFDIVDTRTGGHVPTGNSMAPNTSSCCGKASGQISVKLVNDIVPLVASQHFFCEY
jgi:hypothetical protein